MVTPNGALKLSVTCAEGLRSPIAQAPAQDPVLQRKLRP